MERIELLWMMFLEYKKGYGFKEHSHNYYQFFLIISGNNNEYIEVNNRKIKMETNRFIFVKKNILHKMPSIKSETINFIDVKFFVKDKKIEKILDNIPESIDVKNEKILEIIYDVKKHWRDDLKYSKYIISNELELIFMLILEEKEKYLDINNNEEDKIKILKRHVKTKISVANDVTLKIIDYIEKNYNKEFNLNDLEENLHYSKEYLCRNFKKNMGWTIIYFFNYIKILEAIRLLKNMDNTIEYISEYLNFSSSQYFSKVFKKFIGLSPNEFKKSQKKEIFIDELEHGKFDYRYKEKR